MEDTEDILTKRHRGTQSQNPRKRQRRRRTEQTLPPSKPADTCSVCSGEPKYKCPTCRAFYCSVACCRTHKETCSKINKEEKETTKINKETSKYVSIDSLPQYFSLKPTFPSRSNRIKRNNDLGQDDNDDDDSLDEQWKITESMKSNVKRSEWLRNELKDGGLRTLISGIVNTSGSQKHLALKQAKERYPLFQTFLDKLLVLAGVLQRQEEEEEEGEIEGKVPMEEYLERDWQEEPPMLSLKPILRRTTPIFEPVHHSSSESESTSSEDETSSSASSSSSSIDSSSSEDQEDSD